MSNDLNTLNKTLSEHYFKAKDGGEIPIEPGLDGLMKASKELNKRNADYGKATYTFNPG